MADRISSPSKNKYNLVLSTESEGQILLQDPAMQLPKGESRIWYWECGCHSKQVQISSQ